MSAQVDLTLYDGQATPAAHVFVASGVTNGVATWFEKTSATISGFFKATLSMKFPLKASDPVRHSWKLSMPTVVTETINSVDYQKVVRSSFCSVDFVIAPDATLQERKDIVEYCYSVISTAAIAGNLYNQVVNIDPTT